MVQKKIVTMVDDVTGEEAEDIDTHTILIDGAGVEIDLTSENHDRLLEILHPYLSAASARRVRGGVATAGSKGTRRGAATAGSVDLAKIRAWGRENGYEVSERGRVSAQVREAYEKANS
ncbi:Lsr2 family protein [Streptomyces sp. NPDC048384]|uniref:histone-like nucleoid-structuring protein Lsr2 n=1 Tax=Streptomyces sp. NPDC048384 TaxID=3155487 RepID=UPI0034275AD6